jgi:serine/threonine-protein kinase RsbW
MAASDPRLRRTHLGYFDGRAMTVGRMSIMNASGCEHLSGTYPAVAETVPMLRRALADLAADAGGTPRQVTAVRLAVSEALTNVVVHAYRGSSGSVHVSADVASGELWVLIADDGCGLHTVADSPGLGMGLALMSEVSDDFAIVSRSTGGIEVRMRFSLGPDRLPDDQPRGSDLSADRPAKPIFSTTT